MDDTSLPEPAPVASLPDDAPPPRRPLHIAAKGLPPHVLAGVKALRRWDDLFDVTDDELARAVKAVANIRIG